MKFPLVLAAVLTFAASCKKDQAPTQPATTETIDTLYPGDYFPAYPNSYWSYIDENGVISTKTTDTAYGLKRFGLNEPYYMVPKYDGQFVNKYVTHDQNYFTTRLCRIM